MMLVVSISFTALFINHWNQGLLRNVGNFCQDVEEKTTTYCCSNSKLAMTSARTLFTKLNTSHLDGAKHTLMKWSLRASMKLDHSLGHRSAMFTSCLKCPNSDVSDGAWIGINWSSLMNSSCKRPFLLNFFSHHLESFAPSPHTKSAFLKC